MQRMIQSASGSVFRQICRELAIGRSLVQKTALLLFFMMLPAAGAGMPAEAIAAGLSEDHTVLYYLVELQRRFTKTCGGAPMPEAPPLVPSVPLRELAQKSASQGKGGAELEVFAAANGLQGISFFAVRFSGTEVRQAFENLKAAYCPNIMKQEYRYIGASAENGQWILLMAAAEPGQASLSVQAGSPPGDGATPASSPEGAVPGEVTPPSLYHPLADSEHAGQVADAREPFRLPSAGVSPAQTSGQQSGASQSAVSSQDLATPGADPYAAAAPIVVGEMQLGPGGKPVGPLLPPSSVGKPASKSETPEASRMLQMVNQVRASGYTCGQKRMPSAPPLVEHPVLAAVARIHVADMATRHYFASTTPEGKNLGSRVVTAGYVWSFIAENIASGLTSPEMTLQGWLSKPDECRNIMGLEYTEAGLGFDPAGGNWVFTLAAPMEKGAIRMQ